MVVYLFGLFDRLDIGVWFLAVNAFLAYAACLVYFGKYQGWKAFAKRVLTIGFLAFIGMSALYAACIRGAVASGWDEFSFWASSTKQMFFTGKFHCAAGTQTYFPEYPPGMQVLEYIYQFIRGHFTEWRLYVAYMVYIFSLFVPFFRKCRGVALGVFGMALLGAAGTVVFPGLFCNLVVDFALGATFAYGIGSLLVCQKGQLLSPFTVLNTALAASMLVLAKQAGKLLAVILLASYAGTLMQVFWKQSSAPRRIVKTAFGAGTLPLFFSVSWSWKYQSYGLKNAFDSGSYQIGEFFAVLFGRVKGGYRVQVRDNFFNALAVEKVEFGILHTTNLVFALFVGALFWLTAYLAKKYGAAPACTAVFWIPYGCMPLYWLGLLASYMYTFSEGEGIALASMQRYLNIYYAGLLLAYAAYLVFILVSVPELPKTVAVFLMAAGLLGTDLSEYRTLFSGEYVSASLAQRQPLQALASQLDLSGEENGLYGRGSVLLVYREGYPHIPVNCFTYMLFPYYQVPWECSYGSTLLWDGDGYTKILTKEGFQSHVSSLGVDYIALGYIDEDFKSCYAPLFDHEVANGQVYRVTSRGVPYELGGAVR